MKTFIKIIVILNIFILTFNLAFSTNEEYGIKKYTQPNGYTVMARHFIDEFGKYHQTKEGYLFDLNKKDNYYYYMMVNASGKLYMTNVKVGIDDPVKNGISNNIFNSNEWRNMVIKSRHWDINFSNFRKSSSNQKINTAPDSVRIHVILVEFGDVKHQSPDNWPMGSGYGSNKASYPEYTKTQFYDLLFSQNTYNTTSPDGETVYGSMRDYYHDMSNGSFTLRGEIRNKLKPGTDIPIWISLPYTKDYYNRNGGFSGFTQVVKDSAYSQQGISITTNVNNTLCIIYAGNLYIDNLLPCEAGYEYIMNERFSWGNYGSNVELNYANFSHIGVHCHEFAHTLGLADQYSNYEGSRHYYCGKWGLMSNGQNKGAYYTPDYYYKGQNPAPIIPEQLHQLGWVTFNEVNSKIINASIQNNSQSFYKIPAILERDNNPTTYDYFLIENRQTGSGWNRFLPTGGLLVWWVEGYGNSVLIRANGNRLAQGDQEDDPYPGLLNIRNVTDVTPKGNTKLGGGWFSNAQIRNISNSGTTMYADLSPYWYGTINENDTLQTNVLVGENVTLSQGYTMNMIEYTKVYFYPGTSLTINGTLNAQGSGGSGSWSRVLFSGYNNGTWSGIVFSGNGVSNSKLSYCDVTKVTAYGGSAVTFLNTSGNPEVSYCEISNNSGGATSGIGYSNSNGYVYRNKILNNSSSGIDCQNYSSPVSAKSGIYNDCNQGNNVITGNQCGIHAYNGCEPNFGEDGMSQYGANYINNTVNVYASNSCNVWAQYNRWDAATPDATKFQLYLNSNLYYNPWIQCIPTAPFKMVQSGTGSATPIANINSINSTVDDLLQKARSYRMEGKFDDAIKIYKSIIATAPDSRESSSSIVGLLNVYRDNGDKSIPDYLKSLNDLKGDNKGSCLVALLNAYAISGEGNELQAIAETLKKQFPNGVYEKSALIQLAYLQKFNNKDDVAALQIFSEIESKYSDDDEIKLARWLIKGNGNVNEKYTNTANNLQIEKSNNVDITLSNFPNPFNPSTTITYNIPSDGYVKLVMYDLLGKEIRVLVNEVKTAGMYSIQFDGNRLSSGIYYCRLTISPSNGEKSIMQQRRMQLLK